MRWLKIKPGGIIDKILVVIIYILFILFLWLLFWGPGGRSLNFENQPYGPEFDWENPERLLR